MCITRGQDRWIQNMSLIPLFPPFRFQCNTMAPRKNNRTVMFESDIDAAEAVTFQDVIVTSKGGRTQTKRLKVDLNPRPYEATPTAEQSQELEGSFANDIETGEPLPDAVPVQEPRRRKVRGRRPLSNHQPLTSR